MINIEKLTQKLPKFETFCSVNNPHTLKDSRQSPNVIAAIKRLECIFEGAYSDIDEHAKLYGFEIIDINTLVKVQLASGLIVLNSILEKREKKTPISVERY